MKMYIKLIGAAFIIVSCGSVGFRIASSHRKEVRILRQLISAMDRMQWELEYRLTPLPELCRIAAESIQGVVGSILSEAAVEMDNQISPNVACCVQNVLARTKDIPPSVREILTHMGQNLGEFDVDGQIKGIDSVRQECHLALKKLTENEDVRLRSYQTLGLCAGAALAILFI